MRVLVTGSKGFIGKNLIVQLNERDDLSVLTFSRKNKIEELQMLVNQADVIVHLAGENRPEDVSAFERVNTGLTQAVCDLIRFSGRHIPLLLASSIQAGQDNLYGESKLAAEQIVEQFANETGNVAYIYRLPNVFGKWCKPNYNSVVATYCHNIAHGLPIQIHDRTTQLRLVYIDDLVTSLLAAIGAEEDRGLFWPEVKPEYEITLGELAQQIQAFGRVRDSLISEPVGTGLVRALYSTYISYLTPEQFAYSPPVYGDERGKFVEMLKTHSSGQFSFFTAHPGITRGGHYHHSKTEKFLVIKGSARFGFRHILTGEIHELFTSGDEPQIVDTVPGWTHDITNIGEEEMIVMLWANEVFDRDRSDTIAGKV